MKLNQKEIEKIYENRKKYREDPAGIVLFAKNIMHCNPEPQQEQALLLFQKTGRVALKAGHGVGKTVFLVILMYHHLFCYTNSIVPCTAPTKHQLSDILWTEAARWMNQSEFLQSFFSWSASKISVKGFDKIWYAVAIPSKNENNLAGFHEDNLLFLIDEAPGIQEKAYPVIEGALTKKGNKIAMIGNPVKVKGFFYNVFRKPEDWGTYTLSCLDSELVSHDYIQRIANRFGDDSNIYRVRVKGDFPEGEDDQILPISLVQDAMWREAPLEGANVIAGGCDVAMTGKNDTVIYIRKGFQIIDQHKIKYAELDDNVNACMKMILKHHPSIFNIDKTGVGAGVFTEVKRRVNHQRIDCQVNGIDFGGTPLETDIYRNVGTEMYFNLREILKVAQIPNDDNLLGGLTIRSYTYKDNKLWMPGKKELMEQLKRENKSYESYAHLDEADALALCFYKTKKALRIAVSAFYNKKV